MLSYLSDITVNNGLVKRQQYFATYSRKSITFISFVVPEDCWNSMNQIIDLLSGSGNEKCDIPRKEFFQQNTSIMFKDWRYRVFSGNIFDGVQQLIHSVKFHYRCECFESHRKDFHDFYCVRVAKKIPFNQVPQ